MTTTIARSTARVVVCGSRQFANPFVVSIAIIDRIRELPAGCVVITGGARGADAMAHDAAKLYGLPVSVMYADWDRHGKRAGIMRNLAMLDEKPDLVIAFWDGRSKGTAHTITEARKRGIPVEVHGASDSSTVGAQKEQRES